MDKILKISQQTAYQLLGKFFSSLFGLIILGFVSRNFGAQGTGVFTLSTAYLAIFYLLSDFGLNSHLMRHFLSAGFELEWRQLLGLRIVLGFLLTLAAFLIIPYLPFSSALIIQSVRLGSLTILGSSLMATAAVIFQSKFKYQLQAVATTLVVTPPLLLVFGSKILSFNIPLLLLAYTLGYFLAAIFSLLVLRRFISHLAPCFNFVYLKDTLSASWPIAATLLVNTVYFRADSFILATIKPLAEVGTYNLSYQIFQTALVLPSFISNSYYPFMVGLITENKKFWLQLKKVILIMLGLGVLGCFLTLLLSPLVVQLISGGKGFSGSILSLRILSLGFPAFFVSSILMLTLVAYKRYKQMLIIYLIGMVVNILLNICFIPLFSYIASSWITVFSEYLILLLEICILVPSFSIL